MFCLGAVWCCWLAVLKLFLASHLSSLGCRRECSCHSKYMLQSSGPTKHRIRCIGPFLCTDIVELNIHDMSISLSVSQTMENFMINLDSVLDTGI